METSLCGFVWEWPGSGMANNELMSKYMTQMVQQNPRGSAGDRALCFFFENSH